MSCAGRFAGTLLAAVMASTACTSGSSSTDDASASCAYQVILYDGRRYQDVANVEFTIGERLGDATLPACDDTGGEDEAEESGTTLTAYEVDGISPKVAVAVGATPDEAIFVAAHSGTALPPEVRKLIDSS